MRLGKNKLELFVKQGLFYLEWGLAHYFSVDGVILLARTKLYLDIRELFLKLVASKIPVFGRWTKVTFQIQLLPALLNTEEI